MIFVAIGANLFSQTTGWPAETCAWAVTRLAEATGLRLTGLSRWHVTPPDPPSGQPDYLNGIARLQGIIDPARLLAVLHDLEAAAGRQRGVANAARTLDLDIVDQDGLVRHGPNPVLPHPRAHLRGFVLHPLRELAPFWVHPVLGLGIDRLIEALPTPAAAGCR